MLKWFQKDEDYASLLQSIEDDIAETEQSMAVCVQSSKQYQGFILTYGGGVYALYLVSYLTLLYPANDALSVWLAKVAALALGPAIIYYATVAIDFWYKAKIRSYVRKLESLRTTQKLKIEELKRKTGYYATKGLLDKFDTPTKESRVNLSPKRPPSTPQATPVKSPAVGPMTGYTKAPPLPGTSAGQNEQLARTPAGNPPIPQIQDRVMDAVVGDTEGPQNKYALICQSCFEHNGLVPPEQYSQIKFKCKECKFLNVPQGYQPSGMSRSNSVDARIHQIAPSPTMPSRASFDFAHSDPNSVFPPTSDREGQIIVDQPPDNHNAPPGDFLGSVGMPVEDAATSRAIPVAPIEDDESPFLIQGETVELNDTPEAEVFRDETKGQENVETNVLRQRK
ncbi:hypothetical protein HDU83_005360 [Entophlyctis luteolus]|nr:hypothetical protein HDU83_005360 [Entophlyctis luteolus]